MLTLSLIGLTPAFQARLRGGPSPRHFLAKPAVGCKRLLDGEPGCTLKA